MNTAKIIAASSAIAMTTVLFSGVATLADRIYSPDAVMAAAAARDASTVASATAKSAPAASEHISDVHAAAVASWARVISSDAAATATA
jgi:hypothetical protein